MAEYTESQEMKIRKGQAFNLAVAEAIQSGRTNDTKFIYSLFVKYFELAAVLQSASIEDVKTILSE